MTIGTDNAYSGPYLANGSTTVFPFTFEVLDPDWVSVLVRDSEGADTIVSPSLYSVSLTGNAPSVGSVTLSIAPASGSSVYVYLDPAFDQTIGFENGSAWTARPVNDGYDAAAQRSQALRRDLARAILAPMGESGTVLPASSGRAGKFLAFDALGNPVAASGAGADGALRTDIAASDGSALIGFSHVGGVNRSVQDRLRETYSVKDFGAKGDGATNDTLAFSTALAAGGTIFIPDGTYMVDYLTVSKRVHLVLANGATIKNRVPSNPTTTLDAHWGIFRFVAGSDGSTVEGGTLDGNRAALAPYYNGHTRLGQDNHWWGIRTEYVDDITILRTRFRNFMSEALYAFNGHRFRALDFDVADCGVAFAVQGPEDVWGTGCVVRGTGRNIGNVISGTAYYIFQHGITFGNLTGFELDFTMYGFCASKPGTDGVSTGGGKEPVPIAANLYKLDNGFINLSIRNYTTAAGLTSIHQAINFSTVSNCSGSLDAFGFEQALAASTAIGNTFDVSFDGDFLNVAGYPRQGLLLTFGGVFSVNGAGLAGETNANLISRDNVFTGTVCRFGIGVRDEGDSNDLSGLSVFGNVTDGVQIVRASGDSGSYPVSRNRPSGGRVLNGIRVTANGESGVVYTGGDNDLIAHSFLRDNGQTIGTRTSPYNLYVAANSGEGVGLKIIANDIDATPGTTIANEVSFIPGAASAKPSNRIYNSSTALTHTYQVVMRNPNNYRVGEVITLKGVLSGSADATGKVVDIDQDILTIAFASAVSLVATSVLDTLTGTGSTSGTTLTGVGTLFTTEVDFPVYLQNGSEYRRIVFVNSNTSAVLESAFSSNIAAGSALKIVRADVQTGVVVPASGLNINGNVTVGPMTLRDNTGDNIDNVVTFTSFPGIASGSRFDATHSLAMAGTGLDNAIVTGLPNYAQVSAVSLTNITAITGTSGTNTCVVKRGGSTIATPISSAPTAINSVTRGAIPECPAFQGAGGSLNFVSATGNPTGTVKARLTINKLAIG